MRRQGRVLAVFRELRRSVGDKVSPAEVLTCAAALVQLFATEGESGPRFELRTGGQPFDMLAVDVAMADGGWKVLCREWADLNLDTDQVSLPKRFPVDPQALSRGGWA